MKTEQLVRQEITRSGPLTFERFMDLALYHPLYGYYSRGASPRGRSGDYFTSVQASPLFPQIFADALGALRETLGTEQFSLIEMGAGDGDFLEGVLKALEGKKVGQGLRVWAVERSRPARDRIWRRLSRFPRCEVVASTQEIEWMGGLEGCIVSNEFFDALPFHRLKFTADGWKEIYVGEEGAGLLENLGPISDPALLAPFKTGGLEFAEGQEVEVRPQPNDVYDEWGKLLSRGYVITFDYGYPRGQLYDPARPQGTWQCFHRHRANTRPLEAIGDQDITAHIDFTQLAQAGRSAGFEPVLFCSQGIFLAHAGQERLEKFLQETGGAKAGAVLQLIHPDAMGSAFWTLVQTKGVELPPLFESLPNRVGRLLK